MTHPSGPAARSAPSSNEASGGTGADVEAVRRFNRFYTHRIGVLEESLLRGPFSLTEARVVYELAHRDQLTATDLVRELGLDAGYLSRIVRGLHERGIVAKRGSESDGRQTMLALTRAGRRAFAKLDADAATAVSALLDSMPRKDVSQLVNAMRAIEGLLGSEPPAQVPYLMRSPEPGDMGWIIHRQAVLYAREFGWNEQFEAATARILADFLERFDPARERCWIAEREGEIVGSIFVVKHPEREGVGRLRLLYVDPAARGLGIGRRLVQEVTRFARHAGYHTLTLWTTSVLVSARRIYEAEGYRLVAEEPFDGFGSKLIAQTWELAIA